MTDVPPPAAPSPEAGTPTRQTILVVDDEPGVRVIVARMLTLSGYSVVSAQSGEDAISVARDHTAPIDLLLTDVRMPGMTGPELAQELRKLRPGIKVMYMSAYARDVLPSGVEDTEVPFLNKPFTMQTLALSIVETLRRS